MSQRAKPPFRADHVGSLLRPAVLKKAREQRAKGEITPAQLKEIDDPTVIDMPTSTGAQRKMRRVGTLEFSLKGRPLKLTAFVEVGAPNLDRLFVPFNDLTSLTETYAGGRYIDLERTKTGIYEIDFNRAYTPYCYYNPTYECPYPPAENRLKIPIRAGEKLKHPNT